MNHIDLKGTGMKIWYARLLSVVLTLLVIESEAGEPIDLPIDPVLSTAGLGAIDLDTDGVPEVGYGVLVVPLSPFIDVEYSVGVGKASRLLRSSPKVFPSVDGQLLGAGGLEHNANDGVLFLNSFRQQEVFPFWFFTDFNSSVPEPFFTNKLEFIIGFRSDLEDGRHYGWIRFTREDTLFPRPFKLEAWDWNPVPDLPIRAGLPPEIPLSSELTRNEADEPVLRLSWPQAVLLWTLESTTNLVAPVRWETVPTGANWAEVPLTGEGEPERYFRLRKP